MIGKKKSIAKKVEETTKDLEPHIKETFIGRRTVLSMLGFAVGGVLTGNAIWVLLSKYTDAFTIGFIGLSMFIISGIILKEFKR